MGHTPEPNEQRAPAHTLTPPPGSIAPGRAGGEQGDPDLTPEPLWAGTPQPRLGPSSSFRHEAGPGSMPWPGQAQPTQCPCRQAVQRCRRQGTSCPGSPWQGQRHMLPVSWEPWHPPPNTAALGPRQEPWESPRGPRSATPVPSHTHGPLAVRERCFNGLRAEPTAAPSCCAQSTTRLLLTAGRSSKKPWKERSPQGGLGRVGWGTVCGGRQQLPLGLRRQHHSKQLHSESRTVLL